MADHDGGGALPDFLILGAMKSGTNTLYDYLCQHPDVRRSTAHEVHFFDNGYARGVDWYRAHFASDMPGRMWLTGETSFDDLQYRRLNARTYEGIDAATSARLEGHYREPVRRLSEFLGEDLWWQV